MTVGPKTFPDHFLSVYQSAVDAMGRSAVEAPGDAEVKGLSKGADEASAARAAAAQLAELRFRGRIYSPEGEQKSVGTVLTCASLGLRYLEALVKGDAVAARAIEGKLGDAKCDPGWASTLGHYYSSYLSPNGGRRPIPYRRPASLKTNVITIKADARIAIVGDWGTGGVPAVTVARQIAQMKPDVLIHLGDIYYSGTQLECQANFLDVVNKVFDRTNGRLPVYTLAGNHDMYSGGEGFYALIDSLNQGDMRQQASFFCLRSEDNAWQLLGMDTGLNDYSPLSVTDTLTHLEPDEEQWHFERIAEFPGRTILLSHHQLFSAFSQIGAENESARLYAHNPKLLASFEKFRSTGRPIPAWFWGHEHSLYLYEPYLNLPKGRCLGHGAIPVFASEDPYKALPKLVDPPALIKDLQIDCAGDVYGNGFAILQLDQTKQDASVTYYQDLQGETMQVFSEALGQSGAQTSAPKPGRKKPLKAGTIFFAAQSPHTANSRKLAFVLGNQDYIEAPPLTNPSADAQDVRAELEKLGFDVYGGINFDLNTMNERFDIFESKLGGTDVALFYYSGHGVQIDGQNYLVPIDVGVDALLTPKQQMQVQSLVNRMAHQDRKCLVFLDACRDNPFLESIVEPTRYAKRVGSPAAETIVSFMSRGLAPVDVKRKAQAFIAFAAAPGKYAYGSSGRRSNFTESLITHLDTQGLSIDGLMNRVRAHVKKTTNDAQDPWSQTNLAEEYYLRPPPVAPMITMTLLGMFAAFITSWKTFSEAGRFQQGWGGWGGAFFGLAVAYGVWRWGRRSLWAALFAFASVAVSYKLGYMYLEYIGTFNPLKRSEPKGNFFENTYLMRDVIGALVAGAISSAGTILGVAISTPALRQPRAYVMLLLAGIVVGVILMAVTLAQTIVFPWVDKDTVDRIFAFIGAMAWQGLLGFTIGYGLSWYVPEPWERTRSPPFQRAKWI